MQSRLTAVAAGVLMAACTGPFDADVRSIGRGFDTTEDVVGAVARRPAADARGVIAYPSYQVALARRGDTPAAVAARVGVDAGRLAELNGVAADAILRDGELLVLPGGGTGGASGPVDIETAAAQPGGVTTTPLSPAGSEPRRHRVEPGETAFSIARRYGVTPAALAEWNGLGENYELRVGQYLLIPVAATPPPVRTAAVAPPGAGSPTPVPPSATQPLPLEDEAPERVEVPPPPPMAAERTETSRLAMPAQGNVIRAYAKGENEGIDIAAAAGSPVRAAEAGTVAAITRDTEQVPIVVVRHPDNLLTVYAGVDAVGVEKGDSVARGQEIAKVRAGSPAFLHFEVREGFESVDPMPFLN